MYLKSNCGSLSKLKNPYTTFIHLILLFTLIYHLVSRKTNSPSAQGHFQFSPLLLGEDCPFFESNGVLDFAS